jgi:hypothetical protein
MEVELKEKRISKNFTGVRIGELFIYGEYAYVKTSFVDAIQMDTGKLTDFQKQMIYIPIKMILEY